MIFVYPKGTFFLLLLLFVVICGGCNLSSHPTDNEMEQLLKSNQSDFDKLVTMFVEDEDIVRMDDKFVFFSEGSHRDLPQERLIVYRNLFAKLRLERGFQRDKDNALRFIASSRDVLSSSEKSYLYSSTPLTPLVDSLDEVIKSDHGDQKPVYKQLYSNWYLYYASW